ncbi:MAG: GAF domain-containing sensor histidine kinase [Ardenticatenia bacterium]|nr:GAF domain-containing sensor histidine kinase [Ardenticatenia bacterium]
MTDRPLSTDTDRPHRSPRSAATSPTRCSERQRSARTAAWAPPLFGAVALFIASLGLGLLFLNWGLPRPGRWGFGGFQSLLAVSNAVTALLITRRYPRHPIGWIVLGTALFAALTGFSEEYAVYAVHTHPDQLAVAAFVAGLLNWLWVPSYALVAIHLPLLFPNGRLLSPRWRIVAWLGALWVLLNSAWLFFFPGPLPNNAGIENPFGVTAWHGTLLTALDPRVVAPLTGMLLMLAAAASLVMRYRRSQDTVTRQQLKWYAYAAVMVSFAGLVGQFSGQVAHLALFVMVTAVPVSIAVAILRYRLYDIDLLINRTLVYGALTALVVGVYALVVAAASALLQSQGNWPAALLATMLVVLLFHPLRTRLQREVNRLLYGERDAPLTVLSQLGRRMESAVSPEAMLSVLAETVARALKLPYVAVGLQGRDGLTIVAEHGQPTGQARTFPLTYRGTTVGQLLAAPRQPGEPFAEADTALLEHVARQAGTVAHAVRLSTDLRRARQRLVAAREEERRRLRRDLHDDLGPKLASLTLSLDALGRLMDRDPAAAAALLTELKEQAATAVQDIRRLAHDLRPPTLDDLGLVAALRESATRYRQSGVAITVHAPEPLPDLPAAVEVAAYRIAQEAMTNTVRHAQARTCRVTLERQPDALCLTIQDDGHGLPAGVQAGIGLRSMQERVAELQGSFTLKSSPGGGTTVQAILPIEGGTHEPYPHSDRR